MRPKACASITLTSPRSKYAQAFSFFHLQNSVVGMIVIYMSWCNFALFMYQGFIGNVPKDLIGEVDAAWSSEYLVEELEILGSGKEAPLGCRVKILFKR